MSISSDFLLHALENDQGLLARTPPGTGVPPPQFLTINIQKYA